MLIQLLITVVAGGIMWFVAHQMAPVGREISFGRAILAVVLISLGSEAAEHWLRPVIGYWTYGAEFVGSAIIVMVFMQLTFWRSLLAVVIFWVVFVAGVIAFAVIARQHADIQINKQAAANPAMTPQLQSGNQWRGIAEPGR
jgi:peptidoglycan/LPS O-acetylase OafA/YrhL